MGDVLEDLKADKAKAKEGAEAENKNDEAKGSSVPGAKTSLAAAMDASADEGGKEKKGDGDDNAETKTETTALKEDKVH